MSFQIYAAPILQGQNGRSYTYNRIEKFVGVWRMKKRLGKSLGMI
jgi:hypothetical protein